MSASRLTIVDRLAIGVPFAWLLAFLALPLVAVIGLSVHHVADAIPPVEPLWTVQDGHVSLHAGLGAFRTLAGDSLYRRAFLSALINATGTAALCVLIGFPIALAMAQAPPRRRQIYLLLAILPFWTSFLMRAYAWIGLIRDSGPINSLLMSAGIVHEPLPMLYSHGAVLLVMVYSYLPFFILPMYAVLEKLPTDLLAAAADLGAPPLYAFRTVTLPLAMPGVVAGGVLVFVPALGEYVIPELVGDSGSLMIGGILWDEFFQNRDWPLAAAIAVAALVIMLVPTLLLRRRFAQLAAAQ